MFRASILSPILVLSSTLMAAPPDVAPPPPPAATRPRLPLDVGIGLEATDILLFLGAPAFQRELNVMPDALARAKELRQKVQHDLGAAESQYISRLREIIANGGNLGQQQRDLRRDLELTVFNLRDRTDSTIRDLLDNRQRIRLEELELQAIGPGAFTAPSFKEFRARLNLEPDQVEAVNALAKRCSAELLRVATPPPNYDSFTREQRRAHYDSVQSQAARVRESTMTAIDKVMTREQRDAYRRLLGEPFDFSSVRSKPFGDGRPPEKTPR